MNNSCTNIGTIISRRGDDRGYVVSEDMAKQKEADGWMASKIFFEQQTPDTATTTHMRFRLTLKFIIRGNYSYLL
jgi:hypothetical protein